MDTPRTLDKMEDIPWKEPKVYLAKSQEVPTELKPQLSEWVKSFIDLSEFDARAMLSQRWQNIQNPELKELASVLCDFSLAGISEYEEGGSVRFSKGDDKNSLADQFFIPSPLDVNLIDSKLISSGMSNVEGLKEFLICFGGLAEAIDCAGSFRYSEEWPRWGGDSNVGNYGFPWPTDTEGFDDWVGSLMFYYAANGCQILVRPDGAVAWHIVQEQRIHQIATTFLEFVSQYVEHWKLDGFNIYDPYSEPYSVD